MWNLSKLTKVQLFTTFFWSKISFNHLLISVRMPKSIFNPFLSAIFVVISQKSNLNRKIYVFRLISVVWMSPCLSLQLGLSKNLMRVSSRTCSRTYCGCLRTSLRTFLRTNTSSSELSLPPYMNAISAKKTIWLSVISKDISNTHYNKH